MGLDGRLDAALEMFLAAMTDGLRESASRGRSVRRSYCIAGESIAVRCAGASLAAHLLPALQHLETPASPTPALDVDAFELNGSETPIAIPAALRSAARRAAPSGADETASTLYTYLGERFRLTWFRSASHAEISVLDLDRGRALVALVHDGHPLPSAPASAPLRSLFALWFERHGMSVVHAAAVGGPLGGVVIGGKSGAGKSTIALSCLGTALRWAGDDSLLIDMRGDVRVHSLYCSGSVFAAEVDRYPALRTLALQPRLDRPKMLFFLGEQRRWTAPTLAVRAILVPTFSERSVSRLIPTSPTQALLALGPASITLAGGRASERLARIADLVRAVPSFTLELGTQTADLPDVIAALLDRPGAVARAS